MEESGMVRDMNIMIRLLLKGILLMEKKLEKLNNIMNKEI